MDKLSIKKEISELANSIKAQSDNFGEQISKAELDEMMRTIGQLHKKCSVLEHMNSSEEKVEEATPQVKEPIITPAPKAEEPEKIETLITPATPIEKEVVDDAPVKIPEPVLAEKIEKEEPITVPVPPTSSKKMAIGINDKFQFIRELFGGNLEKYEEAISKLNTIAIQEEAQLYFKSLQEINNWEEEAETVIRFHELLNGRFS